MKPVWKISGEFYGWIADNGNFYNSIGSRFGTVVNNTLYNHGGAYHGEVLNDIFIGYYEDRSFLEGPECYLEGEIYMHTMDNRPPVEFLGFSSPK